MRPARAGAALAAALALAACAEVDLGPDEWVYDGPVNSCGGDGDCAAGSCDEALGACVIAPPAGAALLARVVPDPATGAAAQVFPVTVEGGAIGAPFAVHVPVIVQGETVVYNTAEDSATALIGRVVFTDVGNRLPGRAAHVTVYESNESVFGLELLPSTYNVIAVPAFPQSGAYPVRYFDGVTLDATGVLRDAGGAPVDVVVPIATVEVTGQITLAANPANDLEVVAVDPATGRTVSTVDTTTCDDVGEGDEVEEICGHFAIKLAADLVAAGAEFALRFARPGEAKHPVFAATGFTPPAGGALDLLGDPRLEFGALGVPVRFQATVLRPVTPASGDVVYDPAPGCYVAFASADVAGGAVEKWVSTNESGELEEVAGVPGVYLYPGEYAITVIPPHAPAGSTDDYAVLAVAAVPIAADNAPGDVELLLEPRPLIAGQVTAAGEEVPGSAVSAEAAAGATGVARANSDVTSGAGLFRFCLDAAPYVVVAEAPAESGYAWALAEQAVTGALLDVALRLPLPFALRGSAAPSADQIEGIDLTGATIEWYRDVDGRAYAVGRTVIGEGGEFTALLPP